jgi:hypothetical protein
MATKRYITTGRYRKMRIFIGLGDEVVIKRSPTAVDDELKQQAIESSHSFKHGFIKAVKEAPPKEEEEVEEEEFEDTDDTRLSYGLDELKAMRVSKLRMIAKRASLWKAGMTKEEMISALIEG